MLFRSIRLTETEERIINSPYYQRLRWIKQLGFANYIFPGAEHTRFAHAIGVLHSVDQMIRSLGNDVPDEKLFDTKAVDSKSLFHKSCRIAALLHDIGTFPFSHSIEESYIRHGASLEKQGKLPGKQLPNSHEHLGGFIIKNTKSLSGITKILSDDGFDPGVLSKYIKGDSESLVANQLLHSDLDADRMDYLVRDAHHTGIKYGHIDRDYILYHLTTFKTEDGREGLGVRENAIHAVEDFLIARFAWYSQVVKNPSSAKYDVLAANIASYLLKNNLIVQFHELLKMAVEDAERFFGFNDVYFMSLLQKLYWNKKIKDPKINEKLRMLIYRIPPHTVRLPEFQHRILEVNQTCEINTKKKLLQKIADKVEEINHLFSTQGTGKEWIIADIPQRDVIFTKDIRHMLRKKGLKNIFMERDPIKVISKSGAPTLLVEKDNALIGRLSRYVNFIPNMYANDSAIEFLKSKRILKV